MLCVGAHDTSIDKKLLVTIDIPNQSIRIVMSLMAILNDSHIIRYIIS